MRVTTFFIILFSLHLFSKGQEPAFIAPIDIPLTLNGNFGELRSNHFHAGIDLKTKGETGLPIYCIEDGYVSRVAVSSGGYGNVVYIDHPSGYTSVYAHLESFEPKLAQWVKTQQYKKKRFVVNLNPDKNQFQFKQGEIIAKSGNSGSSAGPHLHFEIRKTSNQHPVNPLFFDFKIKDTTKPVVENLFVYPMGKESQVQNKTSPQSFKLVYYGDSYHLKGLQSLNFYGEIGFGIDAIDYLDGNWSKCGIYQMELWVDNQLINTFELDELNYDKMRYINSHVDYRTYKKERIKVHKTYVDPGNKLGIYRQTTNNGIFNFKDGKRHKVQILLYDAYMNVSEINFYAVSTKPMKHDEKEIYANMPYHQENKITTDQIKITIPEGALYRDLDFEFKVGKKPEGTFSPLFRVHNMETPLHKHMQVDIKALDLPDDLRNKALISIFNIKSGKHSSLGGSYEKGWIRTSTRSFGDYTVVIDTIAPSVRALSIKDHTTLSEAKRIRFKIEDELSGIKSYIGTIDNKWILLEYDAKRSLLYYNFDEHVKKGKKHKLQLIVKDQKENINTYNATFYY